MKKIIKSVFIGLLSLSLCACGSSYKGEVTYKGTTMTIPEMYAEFDENEAAANQKYDVVTMERSDLTVTDEISEIKGGYMNGNYNEYIGAEVVTKNNVTIEVSESDAANMKKGQKITVRGVPFGVNPLKYYNFANDDWSYSVE